MSTLPGIETLLSAAALAPSGDNTQPWRFAIDEEAAAITVAVNTARDPSPMNAGQRMARIAVGAAVENIVQTAADNGWRPAIEYTPAGDGARIYVEGDLRRPSAIDKTLTHRATNRRFYDARPISADALRELELATPPNEEIATHWLADRHRLTAIGEKVGRADALMFGDRAMRAAFLANVRFDLPPDARADFGLPLAALELSRTDRLALRCMPRVPDRLLKLSGGLGKFASRARALVESSSGLCLIAARDWAPATDMVVGRAMQRAWLAATAAGLAVQPMMSLPVLESRLAFERGASHVGNSTDECSTIIEAARQSAPELAGGRLAAILRFGYAPGPTGRAGRLPWGRSLD